MVKTIIIDPGHGGSDPGAVSGIYREAPMALKIAFALRDFLAAYDCQTIMTRTTDVKVAANDRAALVLSSKADLSICIHLNAGGGDGFECFAWFSHQPSIAFATLMAQEVGGIGQNLRSSTGVKTSSPNGYNFIMTRSPALNGIPAVLAEAAFVDNEKDVKIVDTDAELAAFGQAYGRAAVAFLGLQLKAAPVSEPSPVLKSIEEVAREVLRGAWGNGNDRINRLKAAGYDPFVVQAAVNKMITGNKPTTTPPIVPVPAVPKAGDVYNLSAKSLYISSSAKVAYRKITGTYYLYDGQKVNGRYRITNSASRVNKTPAAFNVTGWIAL